MRYPILGDRLNLGRENFSVMARLDGAAGRGNHVKGESTNHHRVWHLTGGCAGPDGPVAPNHDEEARRL